MLGGLLRIALHFEGMFWDRWCCSGFYLCWEESAGLFLWTREAIVIEDDLWPNFLNWEVPTCVNPQVLIRSFMLRV